MRKAVGHAAPPPRPDPGASGPPRHRGPHHRRADASGRRPRPGAGAAADGARPGPCVPRGAACRDPAGAAPAALPGRVRAADCLRAGSRRAVRRARSRRRGRDRRAPPLAGARHRPAHRPPAPGGLGREAADPGARGLLRARGPAGRAAPAPHRPAQERLQRRGARRRDRLQEPRPGARRRRRRRLRLHRRGAAADRARDRAELHRRRASIGAVLGSLIARETPIPMDDYVEFGKSLTYRALLGSGADPPPARADQRHVAAVRRVRGPALRTAGRRADAHGGPGHPVRRRRGRCPPAAVQPAARAVPPAGAGHGAAAGRCPSYRSASGRRWSAGCGRSRHSSTRGS